MKQYINKIAALTLLMASSIVLNGQGKISVDDLGKIIDSKDIIILDARKADDFTKLHIKNAINIPHSDLFKDGPIPTLIKSTEEIAKILGSRGITSDKKIVVYDEGSGKYSGRMYWILDYLGAKDVAILDGQMRAWRAGRKPIGSTLTTAKAVTFTPSVDKNKLASMEEVKKANGDPSTILVDVRTPEEFNGTAETTFRKGHIPGAVNINFENVMDEKGLIKTADQLKGIFAEKGATPDKTIILYCETSVRAGIVYNALKTTAGFQKVKVYCGAYVEWQSVAANKVE